MLNMTMLEACLQHHRKVSGIKRFYRSGLLKRTYTWPRQVAKSTSTLPPPDCERCRVYRGVAFSIEESYKELLNQAETLASFSEANADRSGRRAAIAYQLYEAAAAQDIPPPPRKMIPKTSLSRQTTMARSQHVVATAVVDLKRLQNTPEVKWKWGPSLSRHEVLQAVKAPVKESRNHSGYNISLRDDQQGSDSDASSIHTNSSAVFSHLGTDIMKIPHLEPKHYNHHFNFPPLRHDYSMPPDTAADPAAASPSFHIPPPPPAAFVPARDQCRAPNHGLDNVPGKRNSPEICLITTSWSLAVDYNPAANNTRRSLSPALLSDDFGPPDWLSDSPSEFPAAIWLLVNQYECVTIRFPNSRGTGYCEALPQFFFFI
jgi:hypothetical protein